ncbi:MAG: carbamoyltransferase HypF [Candidatus Dadabacteria bacterium]
MTTYHIHINGQVQGVGFRPFVYQLAEKLRLNGWVSNTNDGIHIEFNATSSVAAQFYRILIDKPPVNAIITEHQVYEIAFKSFSSFIIKESDNHSARPSLLITPDIGICKECAAEVLNGSDRWYHYPFTTCLHCGPRYSIMTGLPYDRHNTAMAPLPLCSQCSSEYNSIYNRRHYSQTISCGDCAIQMHLYKANGVAVPGDYPYIIAEAVNSLQQGKILAIKGIGGYLLMCDATVEEPIQTLRTRKHRPQKPFALLYPSIEKVNEDVVLNTSESQLLQHKSAPIVLCNLRKDKAGEVQVELVAPGLSKIGVMLPYSPLLLLISSAFGKPLIATSGNISGSPIIYKDDVALEVFSNIADDIITYDREIVTPQDDSVVQFTGTGQKIILRRSRGLAPNYFPNPFTTRKHSIFAAGGELKAAFALLNRHNLFISQFLGDQENLESQTSYTTTVNHLFNLLDEKPAVVLIDRHPHYVVSAFGKQLAKEHNIPVHSFQHHKAHCAAVIAENNLIQHKDPVLGIAWDGTGYGDDHQTWGSEFFIYKDYDLQRIAHLDYFPHIAADKMSKEPRLSALSLLRNLPREQSIMQHFFTATEWNYYQKALTQPNVLQSSSMGRFLDGLAAILNICQYNSYEGEGAMKMEALASKHRHSHVQYYSLKCEHGKINYTDLLRQVFADVKVNEEVSFICWKIYCSLVQIIRAVSDDHCIKTLAFSGGVFQNELLVDLIKKELSAEYNLYFHRQLSPNDECIGFGQIACYEMMKRKQAAPVQQQLKTSLTELKY